MWAAGITAVEAITRTRVASRSGAWVITYSLLAGAAMTRASGRSKRARGSWAGVLVGIPLALAGYPLGRELLRSRPTGAPPDPPALELLALAGVVAPVEEVVWGRVEREVGIPATAMLFAAKHVVIDRRWRRSLGLALFWTGLGLVRRRSPVLALILHVTSNAAGVIAGHATGRDYF